MLRLVQSGPRGLHHGGTNDGLLGEGSGSDRVNVVAAVHEVEHRADRRIEILDFDGVFPLPAVRLFKSKLLLACSGRSHPTAGQRRLWKATPTACGLVSTWPPNATAQMSSFPPAPLFTGTAQHIIFPTSGCEGRHTGPAPAVWLRRRRHRGGACCRGGRRRCPQRPRRRWGRPRRQYTMRSSRGSPEIRLCGQSVLIILSRTTSAG